MARVEPVLGEPAAVAELDEDRALVVADYHAGIEVALRYRAGVEVGSRAGDRRERVRRLVSETGADRVVFLGDLAHDIGDPGEEERAEIEDLLDALDVPVTLVKGNHDGVVEDVVDVDVTDPRGVRLDGVGFTHGHTWPSRDVLAAEVVCVGHEHPQVRLEDDVGGSRVERAWLRGPIDATPFDDHYGESLGIDADLVVFPAFNDLSGGTWVNVEGQEFLAPFLPDALPDGQAFLLDGTRLGRYRDV
jgi:putative SbcD/Mre11-related phosphoesterase